MSNLEELIEKLCPDGVEYKTIRDICKKIASGGTPTASKSEYYNGYIPWLRTQEVDWKDILDTEIKITELGYNNSSTKWIPKNCVIVAMYGATAAKVAINKIPLTTNQACCNLEIDERIAEYKYVYYWLCKEYINLKSLGQGSQHNINANIIKNYKLPVPPLEVQREIVRILDNFTFLTTELAAELAARQKQYEYYRDLLLTFKPNESTILNERTNELELSDTIRWMKLGDICLHSYSGATPKKSNGEYYTNGTIPWIRTQDVVFNNIYKVDAYITEKAVQETGAKWIPENCVIVAISGASAGRCAINKIKATTNQHCLNMEIDSSKALYKYVFYCLCNQEEELILKKQGARGDLNSSIILGMKIPIPPLEQQQRIVGILDRFDTLCNDITSGLPAEIEARQKQYEYYRDKLLTFKELKKEA